MSKTTTILSCTIPTKLGEQLNLIAKLEERSKSYYVKKALQEFLDEKLEDAILANLGKKAYDEYLTSGKTEVLYSKLRKDLNLDN